MPFKGTIHLWRIDTKGVWTEGVNGDGVARKMRVNLARFAGTQFSVPDSLSLVISVWYRVGIFHMRVGIHCFRKGAGMVRISFLFLLQKFLWLKIINIPRCHFWGSTSWTLSTCLLWGICLINRWRCTEQRTTTVMWHRDNVRLGMQIWKAWKWVR